MFEMVKMVEEQHRMPDDLMLKVPLKSTIRQQSSNET